MYVEVVLHHLGGRAVDSAGQIQRHCLCPCHRVVDTNQPALQLPNALQHRRLVRPDRRLASPQRAYIPLQVTKLRNYNILVQKRRNITIKNVSSGNSRIRTDLAEKAFIATGSWAVATLVLLVKLLLQHLCKHVLTHHLKKQSKHWN